MPKQKKNPTDPMAPNDRVRAYATTLNVEPKGGFTGGKPTKALLAKLTDAQRRRIRRKAR